MGKKLGEDYWRKQVENWKRSGLTQVAYCQKQGLPLKTFNRWRGKELARAAAANQVRPVTLVPVSVETTATPDIVRLRSPGGWQIELPISPAPWLGDLLRHLP